MESSYFLLVSDLCAMKIDNGVLKTKVGVSAGSLWVLLDQQQDDAKLLEESMSQLQLKSCDLIDVYLSCALGDVLMISDLEFNLLLSVESFAERKRISTETDSLATGCILYEKYLDQFKTGQMYEMFVSLVNYPGLPKNSRGQVRYVGPLTSPEGIWFGIELPLPLISTYSTDGSYDDKRYFECSANCGIFVAVDKISSHHIKFYENLSKSPATKLTDSGLINDDGAIQDEVQRGGLMRPPLELGERIVWISDDGPELGSVRWIGILPDAKIKEFTIGVEFDRAIGTGTGKYNNVHLFRTAQNHASLIPAIGLIKADEYFGPRHADFAQYNNSATTNQMYHPISNVSGAGFITLRDDCSSSASDSVNSTKKSLVSMQPSNSMFENLHLSSGGASPNRVAFISVADRSPCSQQQQQQQQHRTSFSHHKQQQQKQQRHKLSDQPQQQCTLSEQQNHRRQQNFSKTMPSSFRFSSHFSDRSSVTPTRQESHHISQQWHHSHSRILGSSLISKHNSINYDNSALASDVHVRGVDASDGNVVANDDYDEDNEKVERSIYDREKEHCYENVIKDDDGNILNMDSNAFKVAGLGADALTQSETTTANCYHSSVLPSSLRRSFDDMKSGNKKGQTSQSVFVQEKDIKMGKSDNRIYATKAMNRSMDTVDNAKTLTGLNKSYMVHDACSDRNELNANLGTFDKVSPSPSSNMCKVFDDSDVLLRLPYTTGRSTFYERADDESLHSPLADDATPAPTSTTKPAEPSSTSTSSTSTRNSFLKFFSRRTPNMILQQINKSWKIVRLPQMSNRRSSSSDCPSNVLPELPDKKSSVRKKSALISTSSNLKYKENINSTNNSEVPADDTSKEYKKFIRIKEEAPSCVDAKLSSNEKMLQRNKQPKQIDSCCQTEDHILIEQLQETRLPFSPQSNHSRSFTQHSQKCDHFDVKHEPTQQEIRSRQPFKATEDDNFHILSPCRDAEKKRNWSIKRNSFEHHISATTNCHHHPDHVKIFSSLSTPPFSSSSSSSLSDNFIVLPSPPLSLHHQNQQSQTHKGPTIPPTLLKSEPNFNSLYDSSMDVVLKNNVDQGAVHEISSPTVQTEFKQIISKNMENAIISLPEKILEPYGLKIGSSVEVDVGGQPCYGLIMWIGAVGESMETIVGIQLEEDMEMCGDGRLGDVRLFQCPPFRSYFTFTQYIKKDSRKMKGHQRHHPSRHPHHSEEVLQDVDDGDDDDSWNDEFTSVINTSYINPSLKVPTCPDVSELQMPASMADVNSLFRYLHLHQPLHNHQHQCNELNKNYNTATAVEISDARDDDVEVPMKGVQGLNNSCYIDASLFCMFAFNSTFDSALHKKLSQNDDDDEEEEEGEEEDDEKVDSRYDVVEGNGGKKTGDDDDDLLFIKVKMQKCLRDSIVNPLRRDFFVSADKVAALRSLLDLSLTGQRFLFEEKDPEEFMNAVLEDMLNVDPFLKFNTGHESHIHQLFIDKDNLDIDLTLTSVQQLIEISFFQSTLKLTQKPACLMLQMPRHGKEFKMFDVIIPSLFIDVTDLLQYGIRECTICGEMGVFECSHCFHSHKTLSSIVFCQACSKQYHSHNKRSHHQPQSIKTLFINSTSNASSTGALQTDDNHQKHANNKTSKRRHDSNGNDVLNDNNDTTNHSHNNGHSDDSNDTDDASTIILNKPELYREKMELFAVMCVDVNHFVSFVKTGSHADSPWIYFDSMVNRKVAGIGNAFERAQEDNVLIPSIRVCSFLPGLLTTSESKLKSTCLTIKSGETDNELMKRFLSDAYICMYRSTELMFYK